MDEDSASELYQSAFIAWSEFDLDAAATFLNQVPRSHRDAAIQGVMEQALYTGNIAIAERMYERLDGEEERRRAATTIYSWLRRTDHPHAEHYRDAAGDAVKVETGDNPHRVTYQGRDRGQPPSSRLPVELLGTLKVNPGACVSSKVVRSLIG